MTWSYTYSPDLWPSLIATVSLIVLGRYSWQHRHISGALPFAVGCLFSALWAAGAVMETAAADAAAKLFWFKFQGVWQLPATTAIFCFVLEYAYPGRWLTRRNLILLSIPSLLALMTILTNDRFHWMWVSFAQNGWISAAPAGGYWIFLAYVYAQGFISVVIFARLFVRSPQHRQPVAVILGGQLVARAIYLLDRLDVVSTAPLNSTVLVLLVPFSAYAIALFRFRIFDPVPLARTAVVEQMREGMIVLDPQNKIVDLNPAAETILGLPAADARGRAALELLPAYAESGGRLDARGLAHAEIDLGMGTGQRSYTLDLSPLKDGRGLQIGQLLLLHDVTEQKRGQTRIVEQQRALATLSERERLARELHDSTGQVLGYVSLQAQAIRKRLRDGETATADAQLARLANVAQEAHHDVRESILGLMAGAGQEWSFVSALRHYLEAFRENYGIRTELNLPPELGEQVLNPDAEVQLLRVIQEALTNARKHGGARSVCITVAMQDGQAQITVVDDGRGFELDPLLSEAGSHFGLVFMRERMAQIGGNLTINSEPGTGTQVTLQAPVPEEREGER